MQAAGLLAYLPGADDLLETRSKHPEETRRMITQTVALDGDTEDDQRSSVAWRLAALRAALSHAEHFLPAQAPLHAFVHHNTLHAFEHLPFEQAIEEAAELFGAEAYPTEEALARYIGGGSIDPSDIVAVVDAEFSAEEVEIGGLSWRDFAAERLLHRLEPQSPTTVQYLLSEGLLLGELYRGVSRDRRDQLRRLSRLRYADAEGGRIPRLLEEAWRALLGNVPRRVTEERVGPRRRDQLLHLIGEDADSLSMPHLIRLAASYLDQGISFWSMPEREYGFYHCFRELYKAPVGVLEKWMIPLGKELVRQDRAGYDAEAACLWALDCLGVEPDRFGAYVQASLLALRGFAGMFAVAEATPEKFPIQAPPSKLVDYLAVALTLEVYAARHVAQSNALTLSAWLPPSAPLAELDRVAAPSRVDLGPDLPLAYEAFVLLQLMPVELDGILDRDLGGAWIQWVMRLSELPRRRLLWRALERHHLVALTQGLAEHVDWLRQRRIPEPKVQAIFCIDDREGSYRRQLEEAEPGFSTYSAPGFFGIAMRYHALGDVRPRDLCPVVMKADHVVREVPAGQTLRRGWFGSAWVQHRHSGQATTLVRGYLSSALGVLSIVPLVFEVLFPRWFHARRRKAARVRTELAFVRERLEVGHPRETELAEGYSDAEMVEHVGRLLGDIGLTENFCPLVLVIGHGASSTNNPLIAAYGCGATSGGCGGPNARVFCAMANRPAVREGLRARGIDVPEGTVFVAGVHDTTSDDVILYPSGEFDGSVAQAMQIARRGLDEASKRHAHERCRLFLQVPTDVDFDEAKAIVESRSADLAAVRPEYNHAKNSCAIVGRRKYTRGLFLDKRAFLVSTDPTADPNGEALERQLVSSVLVGAGINLEYFFGTIDNQHYGCGSKLPHNVTGLVGIMNGHASDLQTGLTSQMVEPHEPVRLVAVIESEPEKLLLLFEKRPALKRLVLGGWMQVVAWLPERNELFHFENGDFHRLTPAGAGLDAFEVSLDAYRGRRETLPLAHIEASLEMSA